MEKLTPFLFGKIKNIQQNTTFIIINDITLYMYRIYCKRYMFVWILRGRLKFNS